WYRSSPKSGSNASAVAILRTWLDEDTFDSPECHFHRTFAIRSRYCLSRFAPASVEDRFRRVQPDLIGLALLHEPHHFVQRDLRVGASKFSHHHLLGVAR